MNKLLHSILNHIPNVTIPKPDGSPYLTRGYLLLKDREFGNVFLHYFHSSDMDIAPAEFGGSGTYLLHNHPLKWAFSFNLGIGYKEERRRDDGTVYIRTIKPFSFNFIRRKDFHRVILHNENQGVFTIFVTGPRLKEGWCFWDRVTKKHIDFTLFKKAIA